MKQDHVPNRFSSTPSSFPRAKESCGLPAYMKNGIKHRCFVVSWLVREMPLFLAIGLWLFGMLPAGAQLPPANPVRQWVLAGGTSQAALVTFDGKVAVLKLSTGQRTSVPLESLGDADRAYLLEWGDRQPVVLPDTAGVDSSKIQVEIVTADEKNTKFVYRTQHFEFTSEGKLTQNLLRDVARNFEATYELLKALPWDVQPEPEEGGRFRALLVESRWRYKEEGGAENSGGIYFRSRKMFIVPFESIGLKQLGKSFTQASDYRSDTLVHELTHQMMHAWLDLLPEWVVEGTAEYTNVLPLRFGIFRVSSAKSGLKNYLEFLKVRDGIPEAYPIETLFGITAKQWSETLEKTPKESHRMYFTAYLLVNYFMHLDGKGDGKQFVKYMREVGKQRKEVEDYRKAVEDFKKLPGVEVLPDGRYRWPGTLTHPPSPDCLASPEKRTAFDKTTLDILLNGRSTAQLMDQIRSAYRRLGIKL